MMVVFTFHELDATNKAITFWLEFARSEHRNSIYVVLDNALGVPGKNKKRLEEFGVPK
jgi:hypothetical protein